MKEREMEWDGKNKGKHLGRQRAVVLGFFLLAVGSQWSKLFRETEFIIKKGEFCGMNLSIVDFKCC